MKIAAPTLLTLMLAVSGCGGTRPPCSASTCEGCCDATGVCRIGTANDACGAKGGSCAVCASACMAGACAVTGGGMDAGSSMDAGTTCQPSTEAPTGRSDLGGALVLSEFTGAAAELHQAYLVNPHDLVGVKDAICAALNQSPAEGRLRMRALRRQVLKIGRAHV